MQIYKILLYDARKNRKSFRFFVLRSSFFVLGSWFLVLGSLFFVLGSLFFDEPPPHG